MANKGAVSRSRVGPAGVGPAPSPAPSMATKGRGSTMQIMGFGVLLAMGFVVIYMYRVMESMHREQESMRRQLERLSDESRPGARAAEQVSRRHATQIPPLPLEDDTVPAAFPEEVSAGQKEPAERVMPPQRPDLEEVEGLYYEVGGGDSGEPAERRKLSFLATVGTGATDGCYTITDASAVNFDVSSATGCGTNPNEHPCPDCFVTSTMSQDVTLTISACSSAQWIRGQSRVGIWIYTFINPHATRSLAITDNSASSGRVTYNIPAGSYVQAHCAKTLGTSNRLYFPSSQLPTLTVDNAITLTAGNFDASSSSGTFDTSTGTNTLNGNTEQPGALTFKTGTSAVSLRGDTTVTGTKTLTVGATSSGGGLTTLYGALTVAESGNTKTLTLHGPFTQQGSGTFSTATGDITLNGDTTISANNFFHQAGSGTFTTASGAVSLNGDTTVSGTKTFTSGSGAVSLLGSTSIADDKDFTVGAAGSTGTTIIYTPTTIGQAANGATLTVKGHLAQVDGSDGAKTFSTGTGAITLNGDTTITADKNLHMTASSTGTFQTGVGQITVNGDFTQTSTKTFTTGAGAVLLSGSTEVADGKPFTVGSAGNAGDTQLFGNTYIGGSGNTFSRKLDIYGNVFIRDDGDGNVRKLDVLATGGSNFYGDVLVKADKDFQMESTGGGTFSTGAGAVSLNGDVTVVTGKTFKITDEGSAAQIQCDTQGAYDVNKVYCYAR